jgi:peptidyl-prolyl cis-trans isomerase C
MNRLFMVSAVILLACATLPSLAQEAGQAAQDAPGPAVQQERGTESDAVVARVSGEPITEKQVLATIDQIIRRQQMLSRQPTLEDVSHFHEALDTLTDMVLLKNEGKKKSITVAEAKIDEVYQNLAASFPSPEQFNQAMERQHLTENALRKSIGENLLYQEVLDQALKDLPATSEQEVRQFYEDNPQYFEEPEQVHAAHILLKVDPEISPEKKEEVRKRLEALREEIIGGKISFEEAAAKNSEDESNAQNGGELGFFARGQMVKPFEDAAFAAEAGTYTPVVETRFGYHLIRVIEFKPAGKRSIEDSRKNIEDYLQQKARQEGTQKYIEGLRSTAEVETLMSEEEWNGRHPRK